jgi:glycerol 2-dehydrogenase (NADP+)
LLFLLVARGSSVLAKSVTPARIEANRKDLIHLDAEDVATIKKYSDELAATKSFQRFVFPAFGKDFGFPDKI